MIHPKNAKVLLTYQPLQLKLHQVHGKLGSQARGVKFDWAAQTNKFDHLENLILLMWKLNAKISLWIF